MTKYNVVIPAAGQGKRMNAGKNKQFLTIDQDPLLVHTIRVFEEDLLCTEIVLVVNKDEIPQIERLIKHYQFTKVSKIVVGGKERQHSVFEGLKAIDDDSIVLIHDGARPFIRHEIIRELIQVTEQKGAAVVGVPVKDTMKLVQQGQITKTVDRSNLWSIQTPQAFHLEEVKYAHETAVKDGFLGTDDASLLEYINRPVAIVQGDYENLKVTTPEDLLFAESIVKKRKGEQKI